MMRVTAVAALFTDLAETELVAWVERGWVRPEPTGEDWSFQEIDVARVRLIHDLRSHMDVNDEALPLVLSLLDQVYDLRGSLHRVLRAIDGQPAAVRRAILAAL